MLVMELIPCCCEVYTHPPTKPNFTFYIKWVSKLFYTFLVTWVNCSTHLVTWVNCSTHLVTWVNCSTHLVTWVNCSTQLPSAVLMWFLKQLHSVFLLWKRAFTRSLTLLPRKLQWVNCRKFNFLWLFFAYVSEVIGNSEFLYLSINKFWKLNIKRKQWYNLKKKGSRYSTIRKFRMLSAYSLRNLH